MLNVAHFDENNPFLIKRVFGRIPKKCIKIALKISVCGHFDKKNTFFTYVMSFCKFP